MKTKHFFQFLWVDFAQGKTFTQLTQLEILGASKTFFKGRQFLWVYTCNFPIREIFPSSFSGAHNLLLPLVSVCNTAGSVVFPQQVVQLHFILIGCQASKVSWFPVRAPSQARKKPVSQAALHKAGWMLHSSPFIPRIHDLSAFSWWHQAILAWVCSTAGLLVPEQATPILCYFQCATHTPTTPCLQTMLVPTMHSAPSQSKEKQVPQKLLHVGHMFYSSLPPPGRSRELQFFPKAVVFGFGAMGDKVK